jgi:hypothetical protein
MNEQMIGLGRRQAEDPRDKGYALKAPRPELSRRSMHWIMSGPCDDQGGTSQCVAYSGVHWLRSFPVLNKRLNQADLYKDCQRNDEWAGEDYDGTSVRALFKVLKQRGLVSEYRWAWDAETCVNHLLTTGPMVVGTEWTMEMARGTDRFGYIAPDGEVVGGHAYLLIGASRDKKNPDGTIGAVRIVNSWGPKWGQKGRAWLSVPDLRRLLERDGEACTATEIKGA